MKNYTSKVPAEQSVEDIEYLLVKFGALGISKEYRDGGVASISFVIEAPETKLPVSIRMPANPEAAYEILVKNAKYRPTAAKQKTLREQAKRTAWRLMYDWVAVQLSLIEMKQAELRQVFLPYITSADGTSLYQFLKEKKLPALGFSGKGSESEDAEG
jgi:hypothetical protein